MGLSAVGGKARFYQVKTIGEGVSDDWDGRPRWRP